MAEQDQKAAEAMERPARDQADLDEELVGCECGRFDLECPHTRVTPVRP